jgi:ferric-dicitrate binding protein FerR (iron transport regulator)
MSTSTVAVDSRASEVGRMTAGLRGPGIGLSPLARRQIGLPDKVRPGRRAGRGARPQARPDQSLPAPRSLLAAGAKVRACAPPAPARARIGASTRWRLTERGIAVVLVSLAMIAAAALAVVSLTALRVTSGEYQTGAGQYAAQR